MKRQLICLFWLMVISVSAETPLVILHTNDTHSQLEPFPADDPRNPDLGGIVRREALCREVRSTEPNVLYFESGDFLQGTPYFNLFKGEAEIRLMNYLKPAAVTLGNHEFDNGIHFLAAILKQATFPVICTNYDVSGTELKKYVKPWLIVKSGKLRVGIVSANINPEGLIAKPGNEGLIWLDPLKTVDERAAWLKKRKQCDLVICLSHLGFRMGEKEADDLKLAAGSRNIDVILGGHTHSFFKEPVIQKNLDGHDVMINQVGTAGIYVGRLDLKVGKR